MTPSAMIRLALEFGKHHNVCKTLSFETIDKTCEERDRLCTCGWTRAKKMLLEALKEEQET